MHPLVPQTLPPTLEQTVHIRGVKQAPLCGNRWTELEQRGDHQHVVERTIFDNQISIHGGDRKDSDTTCITMCDDSCAMKESHAIFMFMARLFLELLDLAGERSYQSQQLYRISVNDTSDSSNATTITRTRD